MGWEPDCYKPDRPSFYVSDADSYNWAVDDFNRYLASVKDYLSCLSGEAESDQRAAARAIADSANELQDEVLRELDNARSDLEYERSNLD